MWKLNSIVSGGMVWAHESGKISISLDCVYKFLLHEILLCCASKQRKKRPARRIIQKQRAMHFIDYILHSHRSIMDSLTLSVRESCGWETCCAHYSGYHHHINRAYLAWHEREAYTHTNAKVHKWFIIIMHHNNRADWTWLNALAKPWRRTDSQSEFQWAHETRAQFATLLFFSVYGWYAVRSDKRRPQRRIDYPKRCQKRKQLDSARRIVAVDMPRVHCYFNWDRMKRFISLDALESNYLPIVLLLRWLVRLADRSCSYFFIHETWSSLLFLWQFR